LTAQAVETDVQNLDKFLVRFINPVTKILHSSHTVLATNPSQAVTRAIDWAQLHLRGTEIADLPTYQATVTDRNGNPIPGYEKAMSKAQIVAQMAALQKQIDLLNGDGQTSEQAAAVAASIAEVDQYVNAPPAANPAEVMPSIYTPPKNVAPSSIEVSSSAAPGINRGQFTQADVDAQIEAALKKAGVSE
jgi:hypothetical protein